MANFILQQEPVAEPPIDPDGQAPVAAGEAESQAPAGDSDVGIVQDASESLGGAAESLGQSAGEMVPPPLADAFEDFNSYKVLGISALEIMAGIVVLLVALVVRRLAFRVMDNYLKPITERTETDYDVKILAALRRVVGHFILLGGVFVAFSIIQLPSEPVDLQAGVWRILNTLFIVYASMLAYRIIEISLTFMGQARKGGGQGALDSQFVPLLKDLFKVAIIILAIVTITQSWGYSAAGLLAGVGIGGLALAFAAQDTVSNMFGSFVVYADRPYKIGDWIVIKGVEGTVEEIGIRSTKIRKFDKTLVNIPNKAVTNEAIQNYSEMPVRRIKVYLELSYESSTKQVAAVVQGIRKMLASHPGISQEFWMVNFTQMSASSLDVIIYCFTSTTVWKDYMDIRQDVLLKVIDISREKKVEIAFPSQTIYYKNTDGVDSGLPFELASGTGSDLPAELTKGGGDNVGEPLGNVSAPGVKGEMDSDGGKG